MSSKSETPAGPPERIILEYIWLDGKNKFRSKIRVINSVITSIKDIPIWNYDGSSTYQASSEDSEITLFPCAAYKNPLNPGFLVLCSTYDIHGEPLANNHRHAATRVFAEEKDQKPWFAMEQEYFMYTNPTDLSQSKPLGYEHHENTEQGQFYCAVGSENVFGRAIAETHLSLCMKAGLTITGINAEVACGQWEYQIGPCLGIEGADQLLVSRYLLEKVSELQGIRIVWDAKPLGNRNGSGCHVNYSTQAMREENGLDVIYEAVEKMEKKHAEHMEVYGDDNKARMTGKHETASYDKFTHGVGDRTASVRINRITAKNKCGYLEDRRPSSTMNPYLVLSKIFQTTVLDKE